MALHLALIQGCRNQRDQDLYQRAQVFWEKQLYALAAQDYERFASAHEDHPLAAESLYKAATIHAFYLSSIDRAIEAYLRLTLHYPDSAFRVQAHEQLAEIYSARLRLYSQAIRQYQQILDLKEGLGEDLSVVLYQMSRCYFLNGESENSIAVCNRVLKEFPNGLRADSAAYQLGHIHYQEARFEEAERCMREFLQKYPKSGWAFDGMLYLAKSKEKLKEQEALR